MQMIHLPPFETFLHYGAGFVLGYWLVRIILKAIRLKRDGEFEVKCLRCDRRIGKYGYCNTPKCPARWKSGYPDRRKN